ncbi:hypothetical protein J1605_015845 [Eschrichtius robustus]|uniref:CSD domain-containing protein n=1 Tax=Eschrichtius robustus TaxID=9764 RepID=A0AB34GBV8_ESCRO|nr:hypothetical protein J1605_015845 [Eschrichtius robustus]
MGSGSNQQFAGGGAEAPEEPQEDAARAPVEPQLLHGAGICKWFNLRMGFGFLPMTARAGVALDPRKLHMEGFRSLKDGEAVEFTFKKSAKGLNLSESPALRRPAYFWEEEEEIHSPAMLPEAQN